MKKIIHADEVFANFLKGIKQTSKTLLTFGLLITFLILALWIVVKIFISLSNIGKYEGYTAKEWYYEYSDSEEQYIKFRDCVEDYENLKPTEKVQRVFSNKTLTNHTPEELYQGYMKAVQAGDTASANVLKQMYDDEIDYRTEEKYISIFDYCD